MERGAHTSLSARHEKLVAGNRCEADRLKAEAWRASPQMVDLLACRSG